MKKNIIALAIASAVAAPAAMAGAPTVYGKVNVSIDSVTDNGTSINDDASRVGVKGAADLGNGLKAIYKMEFGVTVVDANAKTINNKKYHFTPRNAYAGLAGGFGAFLLGRHDTPLKMSQPTDPFNDGVGDLKPMAGGLGVSAGENRLGNVWAYVSPSFNGVKLIAAGTTAAQNDKDQSLTSATSVAITYGSKKKGLYLAAAMDSLDKKFIGGNDTATETRLSAQYTAGPLMGNLMYQNFDKTGTDGSNYQINLAYKMGKLTPKFKYSSVDYKPSATKDGSGYALGVDYKLGKKTKAYVDYANFDKNISGTGKDKTAVSVGLDHKF